MKVFEKEIGSGDSAVRTTLFDMCRLARRDAQHPAVRELASRLHRGRSAVEALRAAHNHVWQTVRYRKDPVGIEEVIAPIYALGLVAPKGEVKQHFRSGGDCDDQSTALAALILAMGYEARMKVIAWRSPDYTHVYVMAVLPGGQKIPCDPVMKERGFNNEKKPVIRSEEFDCMIQRTLEDDFGGGLCGCGGKCGCRSGRKSKCCPQNANNNHAHNSTPVNVVVNTGRMSHDTRADLRAVLSRGLTRHGGYTREVIREKPIVRNQAVLMNRTIRPNVFAKMPTIAMPRPELTIERTHTPAPIERRKWPKSPEFY